MFHPLRPSDINLTLTLPDSSGWHDRLLIWHRGDTIDAYSVHTRVGCSTLAHAVLEQTIKDTATRVLPVDVIGRQEHRRGRR